MEPDLTRGTTIFVPFADSLLRATIAQGSGIVGTAIPDSDRTLIDYEGALYGQANMTDYSDRVYHAWSRHVYNYPTVARSAVRSEELIEVGFIVPHGSHARPSIHIDRVDIVDEWCGPNLRLVSGGDAEAKRTAALWRQDARP